MITPVPGSAGAAATAGARGPWYAWGLVGLATMAAGPVVGGGYMHPTLLVGGGLVFVLGAVTFAYLARLSAGTVWLCLALVFLAAAVAVADVAVTGSILTTPIVSLGVTAVLALAAALVCMARLRQN